MRNWARLNMSVEEQESGYDIASRIFDTEWLVVEKILKLYIREKMTYVEIATKMDQEIPWEKEDLTKDFKEKIIGKIIRRSVPKYIRDTVQFLQNSEAMRIRQEMLSSQRDTVMLERGYKVWTAEEKNYFESLARKKSMRKMKRRLDHAKIAEEMNKKFETTKFTQVMCQKYNMSRREMKREKRTKQMKVVKAQTLLNKICL